MYPSYPFPWFLLLRILKASIMESHLSFRNQALECVALLKPPLEIEGAHNLPPEGGFAILVNHYSRPGFRAWWIAMAISAIISKEIHWVMAAAWTYGEKPYAAAMERLTHHAFHRVAQIFNFTNMPPMPPRPFEVTQRALAVRKLLKAVQKNPQIIIGLAPEGGDDTEGKFTMSPPGAGRFISHLQENGLALIPVGVFETDRLCLRFGSLIQLDLSRNITSDEKDFAARKQLYTAMSALLPASMVLSRFSL